MDSKNEKQLKKLQTEKENLLHQIYRLIPYELKEKYNKRFFEIQSEMAKLNKLDEKEKNIHIIWIGIPAEDEFDNLKVWAKYNPDYEIHIWTDFTHILSHKLNNIIFNYSKIIKNGVWKHNHQLEAKLKDDFYNNYQLKNPDKTFDENAKEFLIDLKLTTENIMRNIIKGGKEEIEEQRKNVEEYTPNQVILHDVNEEKNNIFPNKEYYNGYLKTLEHLHLCAGTSDRLRYAILNKFGGVYLDTDISMKFNLEGITNEKLTELINSVNWNKIHDEKKLIKPELILNQMILLDQINQLNDDSLKKFAKKWEKVFKGKCDKNFEIFKTIGDEFNKMDLKLLPNMLLNKFPINSFHPTICHYHGNKFVSNAFIVSKKNSKILKDMMQKIEIFDERIKNMDTFKKLINKDEMTLYHTGPFSLGSTLMDNDETFFHFQHKKYTSQIMTTKTLNNYDTSWLGLNNHKNTIKDEEEIKSLFLDNKVTNEEKNVEPKIETKREEKTKKLISNSKNYESDLEQEL